MARRGEEKPPTVPGATVYVDPAIDPAQLRGADAYRAGIMSRRGGLPKADMPLERPRPPIPALDGGPGRGDPSGHTMADYGRFQQSQMTPSPTGPMQGSIIEEAPMPPPPPAARRQVTAASLGVTSSDLLPEQAKADPGFRQGFGSEFAANQPELAAKYGIVRNGNFIPPQKLGGSAQRAGLRPETLHDIEQLRRLQQGQTSSDDQAEEESRARKDVANGLGGSAGRIGGVSNGEEPKAKAESEEERNKVLKRAIDQMDAFEFSQWRQLTMRQVLHSEEERETIEGRLTPLDLGELITRGFIRQRIPIIPGKYEITLQSYEGQIELALKRMVMTESRSVDVGEQYMLDKHSFMALTVGLHKINDKVFPDITDKEGVFSDELFLAKFNMVMKLPIHMLASIGVNLMWFEMRVRRLYSATVVGNG